MFKYHQYKLTLQIYELIKYKKSCCQAVGCELKYVLHIIKLNFKQIYIILIRFRNIVAESGFDNVIMNELQEKKEDLNVELPVLENADGQKTNKYNFIKFDKLQKYAKYQEHSELFLKNLVKTREEGYLSDSVRDKYTPSLDRREKKAIDIIQRDLQPMSNSDRKHKSSLENKFYNFNILGTQDNLSNRKQTENSQIVLQTNVKQKDISSIGHEKQIDQNDQINSNEDDEEEEEDEEEMNWKFNKENNDELNDKSNEILINQMKGDSDWLNGQIKRLSLLETMEILSEIVQYVELKLKQKFINKNEEFMLQMSIVMGVASLILLVIFGFVYKYVNLLESFKKNFINSWKNLYSVFLIIYIALQNIVRLEVFLIHMEVRIYMFVIPLLINYIVFHQIQQKKWKILFVMVMMFYQIRYLVEYFDYVYLWVSGVMLSILLCLDFLKRNVELPKHLESPIRDQKTSETEYFKQFYHNIISMMPQGVLILDENKNIVFTNKTSKKIFGCSSKSSIIQVLTHLKVKDHLQNQEDGNLFKPINSKSSSLTNQKIVRSNQFLTPNQPSFQKTSQLKKERVKSLFSSPRPPNSNLSPHQAEQIDHPQSSNLNTQQKMVLMGMNEIPGGISNNYQTNPKSVPFPSNKNKAKQYFKYIEYNPSLRSDNFENMTIMEIISMLLKENHPPQPKCSFIIPNKDIYPQQHIKRFSQENSLEQERLNQNQQANHHQDYHSNHLISERASSFLTAGKANNTNDSQKEGNLYPRWRGKINSPSSIPELIGSSKKKSSFIGQISNLQISEDVIHPLNHKISSMQSQTVKQQTSITQNSLSVLVEMQTKFIEITFVKCEVINLQPETKQQPKQSGMIINLDDKNVQIPKQSIREEIQANILQKNNRNSNESFKQFPRSRRESDQQNRSSPMIIVFLEDISHEFYIQRLKELNHYKRKMLCSISHELKTPLNCSMGMLDELSAFVSSEEFTKPDCVSVIRNLIKPAQQSNSLLLSMIRDLIDLGTLELGELTYNFTRFNIKSLLEDRCSQMRNQALLKNIDMLMYFDPSLEITVISDEDRLVQIINNFLTNSLKFTGKNGKIIIRVEPYQNHFKISVEDNGIIYNLFYGRAKTIIFYKFYSFIYSKFSKQFRKQLKILAEYPFLINLENNQKLQPNTHFQLMFFKDFFIILFILLRIEKRIGIPKVEMSDIFKMFGREDTIAQREQSTQGIGIGLSVSYQLAKGLTLEEFRDNAIQVKSEVNKGTIFSFVLKNQHPVLIADEEEDDVEIEQSIDKQMIETITREDLVSDEVPTSSRTSIIVPESNKEDLKEFEDDSCEGRLVHCLEMNNLLKKKKHIQIDDSADKYLNFDATKVQNFNTKEVRYYEREDENISINQLKQEPGIMSPSHQVQLRFDKYFHETGENLIQQESTKTLCASSNSFSYSEKQINVFQGILDESPVIFNNSPRTSKSMPHKKLKVQTDNSLKECKTQALNEVGSSILDKFIKHNHLHKEQLFAQKFGQILIVDDVQFNLMVLENLLKKYYLMIDIAHNGQEAFQKVYEKYTSTNEIYKIIFMDIQMPVMDGFQATKKIRQYLYTQNLPQLPIIAISAFGDQAHKEYAQKVGMTDYLDKPAQIQKIDRIFIKYLLK